MNAPKTLQKASPMRVNNGFLIRTVAAVGCAAVELRLLVVERPFDILVEIPVDADARTRVALRALVEGLANESPPPANAASSTFSSW